MKTLLIGREESFVKTEVFTSGIKRYSYELYQALKKLQTDNFSVDAIALNNNYKIHTVSSYMQSLSFEPKDYDIVHVMEQGLPFQSSSNLSKNIPKITTIHDLSAHFNKQAYMTSIKMRGFYYLLKSAEKMALNSDYIIVNSTQSRDEIVKVASDWELLDKIFVINYGISDMFSQPLNKKPKEFIAGSIGGFTDKENERVMKTIRAITDTSIIFELWGPQHTLQGLDLHNKRIKIKGIAVENKLISIYDSFSVYINTSVHEGFGFSILEAQCRGIPVIIYKDARIPEETRKYCIEAEDEEDMARIVEDIKTNGYSEQKLKQAMRYARSFSWKKNAEETLYVYQKAIDDLK